MRTDARALTLGDVAGVPLAGVDDVHAVVPASQKWPSVGMPHGLPDFQPTSSVPGTTIDRHRSLVPDDMIQVWESHGYATAVRGFIKTIDPDVYRERLGSRIPHPGPIPLFATGLADLIVLDGGGLAVIKYRYSTDRGLGSPSTFARLVQEPRYLSTRLNWELYPEALLLHGPLTRHECFCFAPILALGGHEGASSLYKGDPITHIQLITEPAGGINY